MDRIVEVKVNGSRVWKDSQYAGVQGEANVTWLRIEFDDGWDGFTKTITWWDAKGENPTAKPLTADALEDVVASSRIYLTPIPPEALAIWGQCMFAIDGYINGKRQCSAYVSMVVQPKGNGEDITIEDVTPSQAQQLQSQIDMLLQMIGDLDTDGAEIVVDLSGVEKRLEALEDGSVRHDTAQELEESPKATARSNIGAVSSEDVTAAIDAALGNYPTALSELDDVIGGG